MKLGNPKLLRVEATTLDLMNWDNLVVTDALSGCSHFTSYQNPVKPPSLRVLMHVSVRSLFMFTNGTQC
jgi:hypothetical protein